MRHVVDRNVGSTPVTIGDVTWYRRLQDVPEECRAQAESDTRAMVEAAKQLVNDADRAAWLQCLQAAATLHSATVVEDALDGYRRYNSDKVVDLADLLFTKYAARCER